MLDLRREAVSPDEKRERLFTERYESLLDWALRLTNQQRDAAEDLVQDAFVQFMLSRTRLEEIENVDGYLRRMLRYMHLSKMSRSAQHLHETALSVADYDSFRLGWSAIEPPRRMQAAEELFQICFYACSRKESSRAGSVLILRFFHDYFPTEIARVLNTSRDCVDQWQRLARREAKSFINKPGQLRFVNARAAGQRQISYLRSDGDLMLELRRMIFNSCNGECLSQEALLKVYASGEADGLSTAQLAHIVSCPLCLDAVNKVAGLPALDQRYPDTGDKKKRPPDPPQDPPHGPSGGSPAELTQKFRRRLRETREHKPHELRIAVNGFVVSSMKVSSELSELNLNLTPEEPVEFVELTSEQGVQLLFFSINPTRKQSEQWAWSELSEGRSLEACFRNESGPSLQIVYKEPLPQEASITGETPQSKIQSSPLFVVPTKEQTSRSAAGSWASRLLQFVLTTIRRPPVVEAPSKSDALLTSVDKPPATQELPFFTLLGRSSAEDKRSWRRLGFLILLISGAIVASFLLFRSQLSPSLSATNLLERAEAAEQLTYATSDKIRHRLITFEERSGVDGAVVARRKIEIYENAASGTRAQRVYDESNRLVAGVWQKSDGSRIVYHHGSTPRTLTHPETPDAFLLSLEDIWRLEPSAHAFRELIDTLHGEVTETSTNYLIHYRGVRTIGASRLLMATLALSKTQLHPVEQTLVVQRGNETREYRFIEASFELLPLKAVAPTVFEMESDLTGGATGPGRPGEWALRDLTSGRVPPSPGTSAPPVASAELEVDVAYLLNQAKADRNEQVALTRSAGGSLRVEGVVDNQQRKDEFLRALSPVSDNPAVTIHIRTIAEANDLPATSRSFSAAETEETTNTVAADDDLRAYFLRRDPNGPTDDAVRSYSSAVVNRAYKVLFHAIELKRLVNRFNGVDMRTVAPDARAKWLRMVREHATALARENAALRGQIEPIFFPGSQAAPDQEALIQSDGDLARTVERLHQTVLANNSAVRAAFTISRQSSAERVKARAFLQALSRVETLAERVEQYQTVPN